MSFPVHALEIRHKDTLYDLKEPLVFDVSENGSYWYVVNDDLAIYEIGKTYEGAMKNARESFDFGYREYGLADESALTASAIDLKRKYLGIVKETYEMEEK